MVKLYTFNFDNLENLVYFDLDTDNILIGELNRTIERLGLNICRGDLISLGSRATNYRNGGLYIWDDHTINLSYNDLIDEYGYLPMQFTLNSSIEPYTYSNGIRHNIYFWPTLEQRTEVVNNLRFGNMFSKNNIFYSYFTHNGKKIPFLLPANYIRNRLTLEEYENIFKSESLSEYHVDNKFLINGDYILENRFFWDAENREPLDQPHLREPIHLTSVEELEIDEYTFVDFDLDEYNNSLNPVLNDDDLGAINIISRETFTLISKKYNIYEICEEHNRHDGYYKTICRPLNIQGVINQLMNMTLPFDFYNSDCDTKPEFDNVVTFRLMNGSDAEIYYDVEFKLYDEYYSSLNTTGSYL